MSLLLLFRPSEDSTPAVAVVPLRASARERSRATAREASRVSSREHSRATTKE